VSSIGNGEVGARRFPRAEGPQKSVVETLSRCDTTDLCDAMLGSQVMDAGIRPLFPGLPRMAGPAVTVTVPAGSQEVRKEAMALMQEGDVLVVDARGIAVFAVLGGKLAEGLKKRGIAGVVIDGSVRDAGEIEALGLPVFCRGETPAAAPKTGAGEVNVPVACGGVVVQPGDVVVGDSNGVAVVPKDHAAAIAAKTSKG
jgi:RraA family protein